MLSLEGCSVHYGAAVAVAGLSLDLAAGEVLGLVGANGAGKTSILKAITGLVKTTGKVVFQGCEIQHLPTHRRIARGIGYSPEGRHVFSDMTVLENLELGYLDRDRLGLQVRIDRMYSLFPRLADRRTQRAGSMSGGEQQMLAIARALMSQPTILLLDEPTLGLAPIIVDQLVALIGTLRAEGLSILLAEQNAEMALCAADRVCVIEMGTVVRDEAASVLAKDPAIKAAYLGL